MVRRLLINRKICESVKYLIANKNEENDLVRQFLQVRHSILGYVWIIFLFGIFSTCVYQIGNRIQYYMSKPTVVQVYNEIVTAGDMPALTLCSEGEREIRNFKYANNLNHLSPLNISAETFWKILNTTESITNAYFLKQNEVYAPAAVKTFYSIFGTCTEIFNVDSLRLDDTSLKMHISFKNNTSLVQQCLQPKGKKYIDFHLACKREAIRSLREIIIVTEKYIFLNSQSRPCLNVDDFNECESACEQNYYAKEFNECRLPFMTLNKRLNNWCWVGEHFITRLRVLNGQLKSSMAKVCKCYISCTKTMLYAFSDDSDINDSCGIRMSMQSNIIRTVEEVLTYDFISLICDIGGNLSLYLGVSCLAFVENLTKIIILLRRKRRRSNLIKCALFIRVSRIFYTEHSKICKSITSSINRAKISNIFAKSVKIVAVFLCLYRVKERVEYFFTFPTVVTLSLIEDTEQNEMSVVVCLGSEYIREMIRQISTQRNKSIADIDMIDLLGYNSQLSTVEELWAKHSHSKLILNHLNGNRLSSLESFLTVFGNCSRHEYPLFYYNTTSNDYQYQVFSLPRNDIFDVKKYSFLNAGTVNLMYYRKQVLSRVNTSINPCMSTLDANECKKSCYKAKFLEKNISCSLPFMKSHKLLPSCKTWKDAKYTKRAYLEAYMNTDPVKDCSCRVKCRERIFWMNLGTHSPIPTNKTLVQYAPQSDYVEVIKHELSFPIIKLLCDVGSNLGIILGISLLSSFQIIHSCLKSVLSVGTIYLRKSRKWIKV